MNITNERAVMIFKKEYEGNTFYSVGLSKKDKDGNYVNGYMPCQFKNGVSIEDKTKLYIKSAWLSFYLKNIPNSESKQTVPYIFINEFETVGKTIEQAKVEEDPFADVFSEFGEEIVIDNNILD